MGRKGNEGKKEARRDEPMGDTRLQVQIFCLFSVAIMWRTYLLHCFFTVRYFPFFLGNGTRAFMLSWTTSGL